MSEDPSGGPDLDWLGTETPEPIITTTSKPTTGRSTRKVHFEVETGTGGEGGGGRRQRREYEKYYGEDDELSSNNNNNNNNNKDENEDSESEINPFIKPSNKPTTSNDNIPRYLCIYTVTILGCCILFAVLVGVLLGFLLGITATPNDKKEEVYNTYSPTRYKWHDNIPSSLPPSFIAVATSTNAAMNQPAVIAATTTTAPTKKTTTTTTTTMPTTIPTTIRTTVPTTIAISAPSSRKISAPSSVEISAPSALEISAPSSSGISAPSSLEISAPSSLGISAPSSLGISAPSSLGISAPSSLGISAPSSIAASITTVPSTTTNSPTISPTTSTTIPTTTTAIPTIMPTTVPTLTTIITAGPTKSSSRPSSSPVQSAPSAWIAPDIISSTSIESDPSEWREVNRTSWSYRYLAVPPIFQEKTDALQTYIVLDNSHMDEVLHGMYEYRIAFPIQPFEQEYANHINTRPHRRMSEDSEEHVDQKKRYELYKNNERHKWCHHFVYGQIKSLQHFIQVDIKFTYLRLERGFDRVIIRRFNETVEDLPISFSGDYIPNTLHYWISPQTNQSICVEFESDETITGNGLIMYISTRLDACEYVDTYTATTNVDNELLPYSDNPYFINNEQNRQAWENSVPSDPHCFIQNTVGKSWDRGPFYDGKCGLGVRTLQKTGKSAKYSIDIDFPGMVDCINETNVQIGPEYCLKRRCESIDNSKNPDLPTSIRYGWASINMTFNGAFRIDPYYPDLFRVYKAYRPDQYNPITKNKLFDLKNIEKQIQQVLDDMANEWSSEEALIWSTRSHEHIEQSTDYLGARVMHSLLIGRPFIMVFTGSSNTAGHDNMFASSYPVQLQSRLSHIWAQIGANGAAFTVRNAAVGGATRTSNSIWYHTAMSSLNTYYNWNEDQSSVKETVDVFAWESNMNDGGRPPIEFLETHLREAAALNAIWAMIDTERPCEDRNTARMMNDVRDLFSNELFRQYGQYMGLIKWSFYVGQYPFCDRPQFTQLKQNWHPSPRGHRMDSAMIAHYILRSGLQFLQKYGPDISDILSKSEATKELDIYLTQKSGNWMKPFYERDIVRFPFPQYCWPYCATVPFGLNSFRPSEWNIGFRLDDYIMNENLARSGWYKEGWDYGQEAWLDDKIGGQGSIDHKFTFRPKYDIYTGLVDEYSKLDANNRPTLVQYLKSRDFALHIGLKVPWNGNHSIVLFSGLDVHRFGPTRTYSVFLKLLASWQPPLSPRKRQEHIENENVWFDENTDITERCPKPDTNYKIGCHIHNIPPGKYQVSIVLQNVTDSQWTDGIAYIAAY